MNKLSVYLKVDSSIENHILSIWHQFCINKGITYVKSNNIDRANFVISDGSILSSVSFYVDNFLLLKQKSFSNWDLFFNKPFAEAKGKPDYWFTAFYLMNAIQEFANSNADNLGRFPFKGSYHHHFGNATVNIVQQCFDNIVEQTPQLKEYITINERPSGFLLTHDIDSIYNGWKEDGKYLLQDGKLFSFFKMAILQAINKPHWFNIDKILSIEKRYGYRSAFYWIVEKGFENGLPNADYRIADPKIVSAIQTIEKSGSENGLHKSLSSKPLKEEWETLKKQNPNTYGHRYHFLKFNWQQACNDIVEAGIMFDTSLGYAETIGFRNSYGLPFMPFDAASGKTLGFVELPLAIMDRTIQQYMKLPVNEAATQVIHFLESNKTNAVFSILWHNPFFEDYKYKGYSDLYIKLLEYFYASDYVCYTQKELVDKYMRPIIEE